METGFDGQRDEAMTEESHAAPSSPRPIRSSTQRRRLLIVVWIALAAWTLLLSVATSLYAPAPGAADSPSIDWRRGAWVFCFVGGFLSLWIWLASRHRSPRGFRDSLAITDHGRDRIQPRQGDRDQ